MQRSDTASSLNAQPVKTDLGRPAVTPDRATSTGQRARVGVLIVVAAGLAAAGWGAVLASGDSSFLQLAGAKIQTLSTVFLGIFFEAVPFLLLGVLVSAFLHVYVSDALLARLAPRHPVLAAATGALLGIVFPICDCGAIPVSRRLLSKGAPVPLAIAFILAAPVINPVVIVATWIAFGSSNPTLALGRFGLVWAVAVLVALVFSLQENPMELLVPSVNPGSHDRGAVEGGKLSALVHQATDEFFEMGRYLVIGGLAAASLQAFVPRTALLAVGQDPILSVLAMMGLAVLLSVCSTVDAFVALSFVSTFSVGAILAFLAFGPMVDFKSTLMYQTALRRRAVLLLVVLCAQIIFFVTAFINLNLGPG